ncbi:MAG: hypothetical protein Q8P67_00315, partial [archaeon]|nr:hypothetical protein [archaeon]
LRYLCPLFLGSPQLFGASGDFYQQNCLRLVKLLQAAANGVTPSDLSEKTAKIFFTDGNAGRMTSFFSRLAYKPIQSKGSDIVLSDEIPSAAEVVEFFQIIAVYAPDVESALANLAAAGLVAPKLLERWRELLVQWSSLARVLDSQTPRARDRSIFPDVPKYAELEPLGAHSQITTKPPRKKGSRLMMNLKPLLPLQFATSTIRRSHSAQAQPVEHLGMPAKDDFRKSLSCDIFSPDDVVASASRSLESGLSAEYAIAPAIANRSTRLRSAHIPSQPPAIIQSIFPSQDDVRAWDTTEIQLWLEANGFGQLAEAFDSITGEQLLLGQFVLPSSLSPALRSDFFASLNQLKALSLNYFDASAFPDPASQIEALKAAIVKISDVLEMSS